MICETESQANQSETWIRCSRGWKNGKVTAIKVVIFIEFEIRIENTYIIFSNT